MGVDGGAVELSQALGHGVVEVGVGAAAEPRADGLVYFEEFVPHAFAILVKLVAADIKAQNARATAAREQAAQMLVHGMTKEELEATLFEVFKNADKDASGYLDGNEFSACLDDSKLGFSADEIGYLMDSIDTDQDRRIYFEEFVPLCYDLLIELIARAIQENENAEAAQAAAMRKKAEEIIGNLSPEQLQDSLTQIFSTADADGSGFLDAAEFESCMLQMDLGLSRNDVRAVLSEVGTGGNGKVDYRSFVPVALDILVEVTARELESQAKRRRRAEDMLSQRMDKAQLQQELSNIFTEADVDGSGSLDVNELRTCLNSANLGFSEEEIEHLAREADADGSDGISFREFAPLCYDMVVELIAVQLKGEEEAAVEQARYEEARVMAERQLVETMSKEQLQSVLSNIFRNADREGTGELSQDDFINCLLECDLGLSGEEARNIMIQADKDGNGAISFNEFVPVSFKILVEVMAQKMVASGAI